MDSFMKVRKMFKATPRVVVPQMDAKTRKMYSNCCRKIVNCHFE